MVHGTARLQSVHAIRTRKNVVIRIGIMFVKTNNLLLSLTPGLYHARVAKLGLRRRT